jgi:hypothetical protein
VKTSEGKGVGVGLQHVLHHRLGVAVIRPVEVGRVLFGEALPADLVLLVVLKDATSGEESVVDIFLMYSHVRGRAAGEVAHLLSDISNSQRADHIGSDGFKAVILAPIDIGATSDTSSIEDMGWVIFLHFCNHSLAVVSSTLSKIESLPLCR